MTNSGMSPSNASPNEKFNPEVRKLWWVTLIMLTALGFTEGLYLYIYGPYFYEKFGGVTQPGTAMLLTTVLLGLRQGLVALLEVPTGALADTIGRVHVVILSWISRVLFFIFLAAIWLCHSVPVAFMFGVFASVAFAFSYALFNGAFAAWCMEKLKESNAPFNYTWLSSRFYGYRSIAALVGTILGVGSYIIGWPFAAFCVAAIISFAGMGFCMAQMAEVQGMEFVKREKGQWSKVTRRIGEIIGRGTQVSFKTPVLFWIIMTYGAYMFLLNVVCYLWPVYLRSKMGVTDFSYRWILIASLTWVVVFISSRTLAWLNDKWSKTGGTVAHIVAIRRIYVGTAMLSAIFILGLSWETSHQALTVFFFPSAVLFVLMSFGVIGPCFETLINYYIPPQDVTERATVLSAGSMFRSLLILFLAIPSGGGSGEKSPVGWAIPAFLLLIGAIAANAAMRKAQKKQVLMASEASVS